MVATLWCHAEACLSDCVLNEPHHGVARVSGCTPLSHVCMSRARGGEQQVSISPSRHSTTDVHVCGSLPQQGGDQHHLATDAHVCGNAFKQWKPMRSHIPATNRCHGVARVLPALVIVSHHCKILANISVTALLLKTGYN